MFQQTCWILGFSPVLLARKTEGPVSQACWILGFTPIVLAPKKEGYVSANLCDSELHPYSLGTRNGGLGDKLECILQANFSVLLFVDSGPKGEEALHPQKLP